jgi:hypothetical protein
MIEFFVWFLMREGIIELEGRVINELSNTIYFVLAFMNYDVGV